MAATNPPLHKLIRLDQLPEYTGLRRTQLEELIAQDKFPKPVKVSERRKGWLETELIKWQQDRIVEREIALRNEKRRVVR
jgi:prophage regulatory protein